MWFKCYKICFIHIILDQGNSAWLVFTLIVPYQIRIASIFGIVCYTFTSCNTKFHDFITICHPNYLQITNIQWAVNLVPRLFRERERRKKDLVTTVWRSNMQWQCYKHHKEGWDYNIILSKKMVSRITIVNRFFFQM